MEASCRGVQRNCCRFPKHNYNSPPEKFVRTFKLTVLFTVGRCIEVTEREDMQMDFKVGDKAVYPAHGVGVIKGIETQDFDEIRQTFYVLKILDNGMTIMVPVENASAIGMRPVINEIQVEKVYDILRDRDVPTDNQTWNRRYREYMNKIQTGDPIEVGKVLRDLALLRGDKSLSFGERKMYDQAHSLLVQELSVAKDCDEKTIEAEIESIFEV